MAPAAPSAALSPMVEIRSGCGDRTQLVPVDPTQHPAPPPRHTLKSPLRPGRQDPSLLQAMGRGDCPSSLGTRLPHPPSPQGLSQHSTGAVGSHTPGPWLLGPRGPAAPPRHFLRDSDHQYQSCCQTPCLQKVGSWHPTAHPWRGGATCAHAVNPLGRKAGLDTPSAPRGQPRAPAAP